MQCEINLIIYALNTHKIKWLQTETKFGLSLNSTGNAFQSGCGKCNCNSFPSYFPSLSLSLSLYISALSIPLYFGSAINIAAEIQLSGRLSLHNNQHTTTIHYTTQHNPTYTCIWVLTSCSVGFWVLNIIVSIPCKNIKCSKVKLKKLFFF